MRQVIKHTIKQTVLIVYNSVLKVKAACERTKIKSNFFFMKNGKIKPMWTVSPAAHAHMLLAPKHKRHEPSGCRSDSIVVLVVGEVVVDESAVEVNSSNGCSIVTVTVVVVFVE